MRKERPFTRDSVAVLGLPLRMVVSLVIGMVALSAVLSQMLQPGLIPRPVAVVVTPMAAAVTDEGPWNVTLQVHVTDRSGRPFLGAAVLVTGLGGASAGRTDKDGRAAVTICINLSAGCYEGYLDVTVNAPRHDRWSAPGAVKVYRQ